MRRIPRPAGGPTELGLRFFVDALMQIGDVTEQERRAIEAQVAAAGSTKSVEAVLTEASSLLSGLTRSAGVVLTAKANTRLKHIEFVRLEPERALAVLVAEDGQVENRVLAVPAGLPTSALTEASNFLNARIRGKTLGDAKADLDRAMEAGKAELDQLTQKIISAGLASWSGGESEQRQLIVRGHANLLDDLKALEDLERVRLLFDDLETKRGVADLLGRAEQADGVRIFIGSENNLFSLSGSSTIISPYRDAAGRIVGVIGVIGPTRLNYARVIPMVDYTAKVVEQAAGNLGAGNFRTAPRLDFYRSKPDIPVIRNMDEGTMTDETAQPPYEENTAPSSRRRRTRWRPRLRESAELKDKVLRTLAEMENLRRRTEREVADARTYGIAGFARDVLGIADNMQRALDAARQELGGSTDPGVKTLLEGVELTERELLKALEKNGVKRFDPQGEKFDPNLHQAMYEVPDESVPSGMVMQVIQPGYMIGERILRPALVAVSKGGEQARIGRKRPTGFRSISLRTAPDIRVSVQAIPAALGLQTEREVARMLSFQRRVRRGQTGGRGVSRR